MMCTTPLYSQRAGHTDETVPGYKARAVHDAVEGKRSDLVLDPLGRYVLGVPNWAKHAPVVVGGHAGLGGSNRK